ncbi:DUF3566 domain-containing protein [candidate division KSB1 bacterium]|nr:DUF3566 domain-containing protein [candidate division KSB1 bacterium]
MKYEIRRIEIWPVIKIVFILSLFLGFLIGLLYGGLFLMIDAFSQVAAESGFDELNTFGGGFVIFIIIAFTFGLSFIYTLGAVIFVVLYNLLAGSIGGLRFEIATIDDRQKELTPVG